MTLLERAALYLRDAAIAAALFAAPLAWGKFQVSGLALAFALTAAGVVAYLAAALLARRELSLVRTPLDLPLLLLLVIALTSSAFVSVNRYASILETYRLATCALLFWLISNQPGSAWRRRLYLGAIVAAAVVTSWLGVRSYVIELFIGKNPSWRIFGTFFNPNELAGFLELAIPLAAAAFLASRAAALRIISGFATALALVALLLTGSRGGWLALAGGMFAFGVLAGVAFRRTRLALASAAVLLALVLLASLVITPLRVRIIGPFAAQSHSDMFRYLTWKGTAAMAAAHPWLGVGPGAFEYLYPKYASAGFTRMAHQNYLQVAAEMGAPGGIAFLWTLGGFFWLAAAAFRRAREREDRLLCAAAIGGALAFCIHSLLDYGWFIGAIALTLFGLFGLVANTGAPPAALQPAAKRRRDASGTAAAQPSLLGAWRRPVAMAAPARWAAFIVAAALVLLAAVRPVRAYLAENQHQQGRAAEAQGDLALAEGHYRAAVRLAPDCGAYHRQLGRVLAPPAAVKELEQAIALEPTNALNYMVLAKLYEITGPWDEAAANYQRAIELQPNYLAAYRSLAELEARRGRVETALALYRHMVVIEKSPYERYKALEQRVETEYAFAHYALGRAALERGDLQQARPELERALEILRERETIGRSIVEALRITGEASASAEQELVHLQARLLWRLAQVWAQAGDVARADSLRLEARRLAPAVERMVQQEPPLSAAGGESSNAQSRRSAG